MACGAAVERGARRHPTGCRNRPWSSWPRASCRLLGRGWVRDRTLPGDDLTDERDRELARRADALTLNVFMGLVAVPLVLGLFGAERLWLVVSLFAAYLLAALVNAVIRLALYRRRPSPCRPSRPG